MKIYDVLVQITPDSSVSQIQDDSQRGGGGDPSKNEGKGQKKKKNWNIPC